MVSKVNMMSVEKTRTELLENLDGIIAILEWDGESHWRNTLQRIRQKLSGAKYLSGIQELLGIYGGMGSFNDLVIGQSYENGKFAWKKGASEKNEELNQLRSETYHLAIALKEKV